jgi:hypothetical protein
MVGHDVYGLNDVGMLQGRTNAELGSDLFLIFTLGFARALGSELLDSKYTTTILAAGLDETNGSASTTAENATPFTILLGEMGVCGILEGDDGTRSGGTRTGCRFQAMRSMTGG